MYSQKSPSTESNAPEQAESEQPEAVESIVTTPRRLVTDDYELLESLGSGSFAVVRRARCKKTGNIVAIKVVLRENADEEAVRHEAAVLQQVGVHRSIVDLYDFYEAPDAFYLVMEYVAGGELFARLAENGAYSEADAAALLRQVADAIAFLHAQGLCHADIKPENLLLETVPVRRVGGNYANSHADDSDVGGDNEGEVETETLVRLVDFGFSDDMRKADSRPIGTWEYWPPEMFRGVRGLPMDMWSLGVVAYIVLSGYHPFDPESDATQAEMESRIVNAEYDFNDVAWDKISPQGKEVVSRLLEADPASRMTVEQLLQHPWLQHNGAPVAPLPHSDSRLREFRRRTAALRAAIFATIVQEHFLQQSGHSAIQFTKRKGQRSCIETETLASAFRVFDPDNKGYISEEDLKRVMATLGRGGDSEALSSMLAGAAAGDGRTNKRITYGDYVSLMSHTARRHFEPGDYVFREGDEPDGFMLLLSGELQVMKRSPSGKMRPLRVLKAGDFFGETALLTHNRRNTTVFATEPAELLMLSREDFEAGFVAKSRLQRERARGASDQPKYNGADACAHESEPCTGSEALAKEEISHCSDNEGAIAALSFLQMAARMGRESLSRGDVVFREGDVPDRFYIVEEGRVAIEAAALHAHLEAGQCFGEMGLLSGSPRCASVRCDSDACVLRTMRKEDFLALMVRSSALKRELQQVAATRREAYTEFDEQQDEIVLKMARR